MLKIWCNGCEFVIAESAEDAVAVLRETTDGLDDDDPSDWTPWPEDRLIVPAESDEPCLDPRVLIASNGRGYLFGVE